MRYRFTIDKAVNRLLPHYLAGRRFVLCVQSALAPLQNLSDRFRAFAREKHIEARMTSQVIYFEWYLNHRFGKYLADPEERIFLRDSQTVGVDLYHEGATRSRPCTIWYEGERIPTTDDDRMPRPFYHTTEEKLLRQVSFMVCVPALRIPAEEFVPMLSFTVDTYRTAGKTYLIRIDETQYRPHTSRA